MKAIRLLPAIILVVCAMAAAYFSYRIAFPRPNMHAASGGPPSGFSMPKMGGSSARDSAHKSIGKSGNEPRTRPERSHEKGTGRTEPVQPNRNF